MALALALPLAHSSRSLSLQQFRSRECESNSMRTTTSRASYGQTTRSLASCLGGIESSTHGLPCIKISDLTSAYFRSNRVTKLRSFRSNPLALQLAADADGESVLRANGWELSRLLRRNPKLCPCPSFSSSFRLKLCTVSAQSGDKVSPNLKSRAKSISVLLL